MNRSKSKSVLMATRVTPRIRDVVARMAESEGLNVSEWLRSLIVAELKRRNSLPFVLAISGLEEE